MDLKLNSIYKRIKADYKAGDPILLKDIKLPNTSDAMIRYEMNKLVNENLLCKFDSGIYYIPKKDLIGKNVPLSPDSVVTCKYIKKSGRRIGFFTGNTFANKIGISTQVPYVKEICSNNAPAPVRTVNIGYQKYILRRPTIEINEDNSEVLQLLDCLKDLNSLADDGMKQVGIILTEYCNKKKISKSSADQYIDLFPSRIFENIYKSGVKFYVPS